MQYDGYYAVVAGEANPFQIGNALRVARANHNMDSLLISLVEPVRIELRSQFEMMRSPHVSGNLSRVAAHTLRTEILTDAAHISQEDPVRAAVLVRRYRLGEVYQGDLSLPVQDIER